MLTKYFGSAEDVVIPDKVTSIADGVFAGKDIKTVTIGEQVTEIGSNNFEDIDGIVIVGVEGSYAQTYAEDNGLDFRAAVLVNYGDLDGDGEVKVGDALIALQGAVGKINLTEAQTKAADVDNNEGVSVNDALIILQYSVGKITSFPVEQN